VLWGAADRIEEAEVEGAGEVEAEEAVGGLGSSLMRGEAEVEAEAECRARSMRCVSATVLWSYGSIDTKSTSEENEAIHTSHHITPHHTTPHHSTSHHITSHRIASLSPLLQPKRRGRGQLVPAAEAESVEAEVEVEVAEAETEAAAEGGLGRRVSSQHHVRSRLIGVVVCGRGRSGLTKLCSVHITTHHTNISESPHTSASQPVPYSGPARKHTVIGTPLSPPPLPLPPEAAAALCMSW
jgi:hypothetical protein